MSEVFIRQKLIKTWRYNALICKQCTDMVIVILQSIAHEAVSQMLRKSVQKGLHIAQQLLKYDRGKVSFIP